MKNRKHRVAAPIRTRDKEGRQRRLGFLLERLLSGSEVAVADMAAMFKVSERTVRDDITALTQLRTRRFPGGIACPEDLYYYRQLNKNREAKLDLAESAAGLFDPTGSIAASAGTQVALTYLKLTERGVAAAVVTNSFALSDLGPSAGMNITIVGGQYNANINALVGEDAGKGFRNHQCREGLLGVSGISAEGVLYVKHDSEVPVLREMLESVLEKLIIVADISKIGHGDPWILGSVEGLATERRKVVLVTNDPEDWQAELGSNAAKAQEAVVTLEKLQGSLAGKGRFFTVEKVKRIRR